MNDVDDISRDDYQKGYCLMAFGLTPDLSTKLMSHWNLKRH